MTRRQLELLIVVAVAAAAAWAALNYARRRIPTRTKGPVGSAPPATLWAGPSPAADVDLEPGDRRQTIPVTIATRPVVTAPSAEPAPVPVSVTPAARPAPVPVVGSPQTHTGSRGTLG